MAIGTTNAVNGRSSTALSVTGRSRKRKPSTDSTYQTLLYRLQSMGYGLGSELRTIGITSCARGEGVTTVCGNFAHCAAALTGVDLLVLDANLTNPGIHRLFGTPAAPGVMEVLSGEVSPDRAVQQTDFDLSVMPAGSESASDSGVNASRFRSVLEEMKQRFDLVVVDLPAVSAPNNLMAMAGQLDGILLVLEAERVPCDMADRNLQWLRNSGANMLGAVFNKRRTRCSSWVE